MAAHATPCDALTCQAVATRTNSNIYIDKIPIINNIYVVMSKNSPVSDQLPPQTLAALEALGSHLAVARTRRRESQAARAKRMGISIPTLSRMEAGDPTVSMAVYATSLWLMGRDSELAHIASPEHDKGALELDVQAALALGRTRARLSANARANSRLTGKPSGLPATRVDDK